MNGNKKASKKVMLGSCDYTPMKIDADRLKSFGFTKAKLKTYYDNRGDSNNDDATWQVSAWYCRIMKK